MAKLAAVTSEQNFPMGNTPPLPRNNLPALWRMRGQALILTGGCFLA
jgi:hypothetical protein